MDHEEVVTASVPEKKLSKRSLCQFKRQPKRFRHAGKLPFNRQLSQYEIVNSIITDNPFLKQAANKILRQPLASNTVKSYEYSFFEFAEFCSDNSYNVDPIDVKAVYHYIMHLTSLHVHCSKFEKLKPALDLYNRTLGRSTLFTPDLVSFLDGAKRNAYEYKPSTSKSVPLRLCIIKDLSVRFFMPFLANIFYIDAYFFRAFFRIVIQYYTLCRFDCFANLKASDFVKETDYIKVVFPKAKNDQLHEGRSTMLVKNEGVLCPVRITMLYFERFGLHFYSPGVLDSSFVNFQLRKNGPSLLKADGTRSLSYASAVESTKKVLLQAGVDTAGITEKSPKMEGVTQLLEAGVSLEEVMHLGRWKSIQTPLHYKQNSDDFKKLIASKIPS